MPKNLKKSRSETDDSESDIAQTPIKKRKEVSFHESDEEEDEQIEGISGIGPAEMLKHVKGLLDFVNTTGKSENVFKSALPRLTDDYFSSTGEDRAFDIDTFLDTFKKYKVHAFKKCSMDVTLRCVRDYLESPESIVHFDGFPSPPVNVLTFYCRRNGLNQGFGKSADCKAKMMADEAGKLECEFEMSKLEQKYLKDLETFRENNGHLLNDKQKDFVDKKIKLYRKKIHGPAIRNTPKAPKTPRNRGRKSAFDLFCATKADKYTELNEESRIKKLTKKFEKLEDDKKEIFEKLALM